MKAKKINKKMNLNKETISDLNFPALGKIIGGMTFDCPTFPNLCDTEDECGFTSPYYCFTQESCFPNFECIT